MIALLADVNIRGHIGRLVQRMQTLQWRDFWDHLDVRYLTFADLGLADADTDAVVWKRCQETQVFLVTNNRNNDGPDSLAATIQLCNTPQSLPVFNIGDADSILAGTDYADKVIDRLFRYLLEIDNIRGAGRLFLP